MDRWNELIFVLRQVQRKQKSVETQVSWFIDHKTEDELTADPEYQALEKSAFELADKERKLLRQLNELDERDFEIAQAMN